MPKFDLRHDPRGKAVSIVAAGTWSVTDEGFDIKATLPGFLIRKPGVYTVIVGAGINDKFAVVSEYAMWVGIEPPDAYRAR